MVCVKMAQGEPGFSVGLLESALEQSTEMGLVFLLWFWLKLSLLVMGWVWFFKLGELAFGYRAPFRTTFLVIEEVLRTVDCASHEVFLQGWRGRYRWRLQYVL